MNWLIHFTSIINVTFSDEAFNSSVSPCGNPLNTVIIFQVKKKLEKSTYTRTLFLWGQSSK